MKLRHQKHKACLLLLSLPIAFSIILSEVLWGELRAETSTPETIASHQFPSKEKNELLESPVEYALQYLVVLGLYIYACVCYSMMVFDSLCIFPPFSSSCPVALMSAGISLQHIGCKMEILSTQNEYWHFGWLEHDCNSHAHNGTLAGVWMWVRHPQGCRQTNCDMINYDKGQKRTFSMSSASEHS